TGLVMYAATKIVIITESSILDGVAARLDDGTEHFQPSTLALTSVDVGNAATNVIPAEATARLNIRFNDAHTGARLVAWLESEASRAAAEADGVTLTVQAKISGEAFVTAPGRLTDLVAQAVAAETGLAPAQTTGGGTSDARFVKDLCPVVEFGLTGASMHQVDEYAEIAEIERLTAIYQRILRAYFA
ncbi:MAG: M20/M25/M40 family metallo-hydrolase, partial [Pseudomonadota bacterium]